jgi:hypothetical protein
MQCTRPMVLFCALLLSLWPNVASAGLVATFRANAYRFFLQECRAQIAGVPFLHSLAVTNNVLEEICACEATMDAMNVTPDEFTTIASSGIFPPSFRDRKDGYAKSCVLVYLESK